MTAITKPLVREYPPSQEVRRPLIVTLHPGGTIELREKRGKTSYSIRAHDLFLKLAWAESRGTK